VNLVSSRFTRGSTLASLASTKFWSSLPRKRGRTTPRDNSGTEPNPDREGLRHPTAENLSCLLPVQTPISGS